MIYKGRDLNQVSCMNFLKDKCEIKRTEYKDVIEIYVILKITNEEIARIVCFFYNHKKFYNKSNSMHIKSLGVADGFERKGMATYLMKEVIIYAEEMKVKHITVHPSACTSYIPQEKLEEFYSNFRFLGTFKREKQIEFRIVLD